MPPRNSFRHQRYTADSPGADRYRLVSAAAIDVGSDEFQKRMQAAGDVFREWGIETIYIVHGTFVGDDASGFLTELSRVLPVAGTALRRLSKQWVDTVVREYGNYTEAYVQCFKQAINRTGEKQISVRLFRWSSENHHIGRADGAIRLIDELLRAQRQRVMLWGHSHAGNLFALLTNLIAGEEQAISRFFKAARPYYRWPLFGSVDLAVWDRVRRELLDHRSVLTEQRPVIVTFGTPIRYGWETNGYARLVHFVNHRPQSGLPECRAAFPPTLDAILNASSGDFVQQAGIAGTNVMPGVIGWRTWLADRRLNALLQPDLPARRLKERLKLGMRVPEEGITFLVDYGLPEGNIARHHAGHAVYTDMKWLCFHAEQVAGELSC